MASSRSARSPVCSKRRASTSALDLATASRNRGRGIRESGLPDKAAPERCCFGQVFASVPARRTTPALPARAARCQPVPAEPRCTARADSRCVARPVELGCLAERLLNSMDAGNVQQRQIVLQRQRDCFVALLPGRLSQLQNQRTGQVAQQGRDSPSAPAARCPNLRRWQAARSAAAIPTLWAPVAVGREDARRCSWAAISSCCARVAEVRIVC